MTSYGTQRPRKTQPHVPLAAVRSALGLTLDAVCERVHQEFPELTLSRGHLSGIENGHRGASAQMLHALAIAYGLPPQSITTDYEPRQMREDVPA